MKGNAVQCAAIFSLAFVSTGLAGITGDTYNFSTSQTGSVTINPAGAGGSFSAPAGPGFCVGPAGGDCSTSGLLGSISFNANQIIFNFSGNTQPTSGTFVLNLANFAPANIIAVGNKVGSLTSGSFGLTSFDASSMTFTGSVGEGFFDARGGRTVTFDVSTLLPPTISKSFGATSIGVNQSTSLSFTITNPNSAPNTLNGISFTDVLPANLTVATPNGLTGACDGGTITATAGSSAITLSGAALSATASCTFSLNVTANSAGVATNLVQANSTNGGASNVSTASLTIAVPPAITKSFAPSKIAPGGSSTLSFAISNPNAGIAQAGVNFVDTLPGGVTVASPSGLTSSCGGVATATAGSVSLSGGSMAAGGSCVVSVNVTSNEGIKVNSVTVSSIFGAGNTSTATLRTATPPVLSKSFDAVSIGPLNTVNLTFAVLNPNGVVTLSGIGFTDTLPTGLIAATPSVITGACGAGIIGAVAAGNTITLTGATLSAGDSCTFKVAVTANGAALGTLTNTTSTVTSNEANPGAAAVATLFVGDPFQVSYASNLARADSVADITNAGTLGAELYSGKTAATVGSICANVYAFSPDEQLVSCCSCPVTPGGLASFSAKLDLASNTLTPAIPSALVIKLIASRPIAGSCNNSAAGVTAALLANGMKSYETTLHGTAVPGRFAITETPFLSATLSAGELNRITSLCNFILANGSGYGVCNSCKLGGLGGERQ